MSSDTADLWAKLCSELRFHRKRAACEDKVNGIWGKSPFLVGNSDLPRLDRTNLELTCESWTLAQLTSLLHARQVTADPPYSPTGSVAVIRWKGVDYLLDGRRRINYWKRENSPGPFNVIVARYLDDI